MQECSQTNIAAEKEQLHFFTLCKRSTFKMLFQTVTSYALLIPLASLVSAAPVTGDMSPSMLFGIKISTVQGNLLIHEQDVLLVENMHAIIVPVNSS